METNLKYSSFWSVHLNPVSPNISLFVRFFGLTRFSNSSVSATTGLNPFKKNNRKLYANAGEMNRNANAFDHFIRTLMFRKLQKEILDMIFSSFKLNPQLVEF